MNAKALFASLLVAQFALAAETTTPQMATPTALARLPAEWSLMGNGGPLGLTGACDAGVDAASQASGKPVYGIRCSNAGIPGFGGARTTWQTANYRGKRVRVSAWLKASGVASVDTPQYADVKGQAGLWIGVGSPSKGTRSDRMESRAISGTTDWQYLDFVVDVPADNRQMMVGFWMQGRGETWARDFTIEEVPASVAVNFLVEDPDRDTGPDLSLLVTVTPRAGDPFLPPPARWLASGPGYELCDVGVDVKMLNAGQRNLSIACGVAERPALRQAFNAAPFRGKRVRLTGWIKSQDVESTSVGQSGLFLVADNGSANLRANVSGTTQWQQQQLMMEVPRNASWLNIGVSLGGRGQVWVRDLQFEVLPGR